MQVNFNNQQCYILKKQFLLHMILLERFFGNKRINNCTINVHLIFFCRWSLHFSSQWILCFFLKHFCKVEMICINMFFQCCYSIFCIVYDQTFSCLNFRVIKPNWTTVTKNMVSWHFTSTSLLSFTQKQTQHKEFLPYDFHIVLWTCKFLCSLSFIFFIFKILVTFKNSSKKTNIRMKAWVLEKMWACNLSPWKKNG